MNKIMKYDNFNESIEYRPIIKYSTTTAIIDVEMRLIDAVDDSYIIRRASYGMLQDEVSKYSLNLTKINLSSANKPKIYNIKSNIDPSLVGITNSMGRITNVKTNKTYSGRVSNTNINTNNIQIETIKVPFPVLIDKFNIVSKSDNEMLNNTLFYGIGKMTIILYPFDNIIKFTIANGSETSPDFLNLSSYGDIKIVFKDDSKIFEFPLYTDSDSINLANGQIVFKINQNKMSDIKRLYDSGVNIFYITSESQSIRSVIYSGLFKIYDGTQVQTITSQTISPIIIKDPDLQQTAIAKKRIITESIPIAKSQSSKSKN
jgi:hypothetical protein